MRKKIGNDSHPVGVLEESKRKKMKVVLWIKERDGFSATKRIAMKWTDRPSLNSYTFTISLYVHPLVQWFCLAGNDVESEYSTVLQIRK